MAGVWEEKEPLKVFKDYKTAYNYMMKSAQDEVEEQNKHRTNRRAVLKETKDEIEITLVKINDIKDGLVNEILYNTYYIVESTLE